MPLSINTEYVDSSLSGRIFVPRTSISDAHMSLQEKTCSGSEYLGWIDFPETLSNEKIAEIQSYGDSLREKSDVLIVCGIGGSYL